MEQVEQSFTIDSVELAWNKFWKPLVTNSDGTLNEQKN